MNSPKIRELTLQFAKDYRTKAHELNALQIRYAHEMEKLEPAELNVGKARSEAVDLFMESSVLVSRLLNSVYKSIVNMANVEGGIDHDKQGTENVSREDPTLQHAD